MYMYNTKLEVDSGLYSYIKQCFCAETCKSLYYKMLVQPSVSSTQLLITNED